MTTNYLYLPILPILLLFLCLGSFLNVLIYRLPRELSIALPRSFCPTCQHALKFYHNIPVLSFIFLKGQCAFCQKKIAWRYPIVELLTGFVGVFLYLQFGLSVTFTMASLFSLWLISLMFIDIEHQLLPDDLTISLLWLGLLCSVIHPLIPPQEAIIGAVAGYLSLWLIAQIYKILTHTEGMGHGDFKLLAALGAWTGWASLLHIVLLSSVSALVVGVYLLWRQKAHTKTPLAFGPYLAVAGWLVWIYLIKY